MTKFPDKMKFTVTLSKGLMERLDTLWFGGVEDNNGLEYCMECNIADALEHALGEYLGEEKSVKEYKDFWVESEETWEK